MKSTAVSIGLLYADHIKSREDIIACIKFFVHVLDLNFHADTPFEDYVDQEGKATFNEEEAARGNKIVARLFEVANNLNEDLHELCMEAHPLFTKIVIHIAGGMLESVESNNHMLQYCLIDHDNIKEGDEGLESTDPIYVADGKFHEKEDDEDIAQWMKEIGY